MEDRGCSGALFAFATVGFGVFLFIQAVGWAFGEQFVEPWVVGRMALVWLAAVVLALVGALFEDKI